MSAPTPSLRQTIESDARRALDEDLGSGDLTATLLPADATWSARVICRENAVMAGQPWADAVYAALDPSVELHWLVADGEALAADTAVCELVGPARSLVSGERTALNFLQTLSGTATTTRAFTDAAAGTATRILDTRKTVPGLRAAQKYAVRCGGGDNHRLGLFDAILIKENHILACGSITTAVQLARQRYPKVAVEVEVETFGELDEALAADVDRIMLDNFGPTDLASAVERVAGDVPLEISGDVALTDIPRLAATGVDYISIGALTKHVHAVDLSMRFETLDGR
jgi:nicotinate-nucleotide pyrophosphorylase (carboxylating)